MSECAKSVMLSAESEADLEDWIDKLTRVIHADKPQDDSRSERGTYLLILIHKGIAYI